MMSTKSLDRGYINMSDLESLVHKCCTRGGYRLTAINGDGYCTLLQNKNEATVCPYAQGFIYIKKRRGQFSTMVPYVECNKGRSQ